MLFESDSVVLVHNMLTARQLASSKGGRAKVKKGFAMNKELARSAGAKGGKTAYQNRQSRIASTDSTSRYDSVHSELLALCNKDILDLLVEICISIWASRYDHTGDFDLVNTSIPYSWWAIWNRLDPENQIITEHMSKGTILSEIISLYRLMVSLDTDNGGDNVHSH